METKDSTLPVSKAKKVIKTTSKIQGLELEGKFWSPSTVGRENTVKNYDHEFSRVLPEKSILDHLRKRKEKGKSTFVLDLAGGAGGGLRDISKAGLLDGGINVNLTDMRSDEERAYDSNHNIHLLEGDLFRASSWRKIVDKAKELSPSGDFDLIICRPQGAFNLVHAPKPVFGYEFPEEFYLPIMRRIINMLSIDNGLLLTQIPPNIETKELKRELKNLNDYPGLFPRYAGRIVFEILDDAIPNPFDNGVLSIVKNAEVPFTIQ